MNRVETMEDLESIRERLVKAGWDAVTLRDCILFSQMEWLGEIHQRLDKIEDALLNLKG